MRRVNMSFFFTHWSNAPEFEYHWEPTTSFLAACSQPWLDFCWENKLPISLLSELAAEKENSEFEDDD